MSKNSGGPAFPGVGELGLIKRPDTGETIPIHKCHGMTLRDWFAGSMMVDDRLVKAIRAMDDTDLGFFGRFPDTERDEHITETASDIGRAVMPELEKVTKRLELEARAIAIVRYMQADAMLAERDRDDGAQSWRHDT